MLSDVYSVFPLKISVMSTCISPFILKIQNPFKNFKYFNHISSWWKEDRDFATNSDLFRIQLWKKLLTHGSSPSFTAPLIHQAILAPKGTLWHDWGKGVLAVPAIDKGCVCIPPYQNAYFLNKSFVQGSSFLAMSRLPFHTDTAHRSGSGHFITSWWQLQQTYA